MEKQIDAMATVYAHNLTNFIKIYQYTDETPGMWQTLRLSWVSWMLYFIRKICLFYYINV